MRGDAVVRAPCVSVHARGCSGGCSRLSHCRPGPAAAHCAAPAAGARSVFACLEPVPRASLREDTVAVALLPLHSDCTATVVGLCGHAAAQRLHSDCTATVRAVGLCGPAARASGGASSRPRCARRARDAPVTLGLRVLEQTAYVQLEQDRNEHIAALERWAKEMREREEKERREREAAAAEAPAASAGGA